MRGGDDLMSQLMQQLGGLDEEASSEMRDAMKREVLEEQAERERQMAIAREALANPAGAALLELLQGKLARPVPREGLSLEQYALALAERNGQVALLAMIFDMLGKGEGAGPAQREH